jgi:predicted O-methyltransferase YrrM
VRCGYEEKWDLYMQESPAILDRVRDNMGTFDFVFIDGWHQDGQPERDVEGVLPFMSKDGVIVLHDFDLPDVQNAGMLLAQHAYHYHGFHTRHKLAIFLPNTWPEKGPQKFPRWWKKLLADVSKVMEQD